MARRDERREAAGLSRRHSLKGTKNGVDPRTLRPCVRLCALQAGTVGSRQDPPPPLAQEQGLESIEGAVASSWHGGSCRPPHSLRSTPDTISVIQAGP